MGEMNFEMFRFPQAGFGGDWDAQCLQRAFRGRLAHAQGLCEECETDVERDGYDRPRTLVKLENIWKYVIPGETVMRDSNVRC